MDNQSFGHTLRRDGAEPGFRDQHAAAGARWAGNLLRTPKGWAYCIRQLVDEIYPDADSIVLVMDNLNTHKKASLYEAFEPAEGNLHVRFREGR